LCGRLAHRSPGDLKYPAASGELDPGSRRTHLPAPGWARNQTQRTGEPGQRALSVCPCPANMQGRLSRAVGATRPLRSRSDATIDTVSLWAVSLLDKLRHVGHVDRLASARTTDP